MSLNWIREHMEANATKGGAPMAWCLCCLKGEKKRCRFVNVTGRFPMSLDWVREHKERIATNGGAPMGVVFVLPSGRKKEVSLRLF